MRKTLAIAVLSALLLASCGKVEGPKQPEAKPEAKPTPVEIPSDLEAPTEGVEIAATPVAPTADLSAYHGQNLTWETCGEGYDCATVEAPLDYRKPTGSKIKIALKRHAGKNSGGRALLINPGGPGGSGVNLVESFVGSMAGIAVVDKYDVIGFDPRGVGASTAVNCLTDSEVDEVRSASFDTELPAQVDALEKAAQEVGAKCDKNSPRGLLNHVGTTSAAADLDIVRAALKQDKLNYLGYSYGTLLGATYAQMYPANVGRFVLDGAVDPRLETKQVAAGQAAGFETALNSYLGKCGERSSCPFKGDSVAEARKKIKLMLDSTKITPLNTQKNRPLTNSLAYSGLLVPLYETSIWPFLDTALDKAINNSDGTALLFLADLSAERDANGKYKTNSLEAFWAVNCADYPVLGTRKTWDEQQKSLLKANPIFGEALGYSDAMCNRWPAQLEKKRRPELTAKGAGPIVVIGTTRDPATPYKWSVALAKSLESATLLTYDGDGHTAYGRSNSCIKSAVDRYLLDGTVPEENQKC